MPGQLLPHRYLGGSSLKLRPAMEDIAKHRQPIITPITGFYDFTVTHRTLRVLLKTFRKDNLRIGFFPIAQGFLVPVVRVEPLRHLEDHTQRLLPRQAGALAA